MIKQGNRSFRVTWRQMATIYFGLTKGISLPLVSLSSRKDEPGEQKVHDPKARCRNQVLTHEPNLTHVDFANAQNAHEEPVEGRLITYGIGG